MKVIPSDTQMRTILDPLPPEDLRPSHNTLINELQRGKGLEKMEYLEEGYLTPLDGTGYFSSEKLFSDQCMQKTDSSGETTYYLQMLGAAIVHPDLREVIPLIPEVISKQDGSEKNDCEMMASRRFLTQLRKEHPWEAVRSLFFCFVLESMEMLYRALLQGFTRCKPVIAPDTS